MAKVAPGQGANIHCVLTLYFMCMLAATYAGLELGGGGGQHYYYLILLCIYSAPCIQVKNLLGDAKPYITDRITEQLLYSSQVRL